MKTNEKDVTTLCNSYGHSDLRGRPVQHVHCPDGSSIECAIYTVKGTISGEMISPREYRAVIRIDSGHVADEYLLEISDPDDFRRYMHDAFGTCDWRGISDPGSVDARDYDGIRFRGYGELDECIAYFDCGRFYRDDLNLADDLLERYGTTWWDGSNMHYLVLANADIADDFQDGDRWNEDGTSYIPFDC